MYKLTQPPTIGITTFDRNEHGHYHLTSTTVEAIRLAGGLPVLLPPGEAEESAAILEVVDGLIFLVVATLIQQLITVRHIRLSLT